MDADALFRSAETALSEAHGLHSRIAFCSPSIKSAVAERLDVEHWIQQALANDRFILHYQPKIDLRTRRIDGAEALLRIDDPDAGIIGPARFIDVLEASRLIERVGRWVMEEALRAQERWLRDAGTVPPIAVNVSAVQLLSDGFVESVRDVLRHAKPGARLELEITESVVIRDLDASIDVLRRLRSLGVTIALDDFGTGYSSLRYLSRMPLDSVKIDRSFVTGLTTSAENAGIATAILSLARALDLKVVAEGVETEEQAQWLRTHGCASAQGYLFSPPVPEASFGEVLIADRREPANAPHAVPDSVAGRPRLTRR
jgi:EAL domain-containing protein (putative c-di-GMP-specific phosphodiesterase class I)